MNKTKIIVLVIVRLDIHKFTARNRDNIEHTSRGNTKAQFNPMLF